VPTRSDHQAYKIAFESIVTRTRGVFDVIFLILLVYGCSDAHDPRHGGGAHMSKGAGWKADRSHVWLHVVLVCSRWSPSTRDVGDQRGVFRHAEPGLADVPSNRGSWTAFGP